MRTFAVARTTAQWSRIRSDLMLLKDDPRVEPETKQLLEDVEAILAADAERGDAPDLPQGVTGDVHFAKKMEEHLFAERFPNKVGVESTHYEDCWKGHPECAYSMGVFDVLMHTHNAPRTGNAS